MKKSRLVIITVIVTIIATALLGRLIRGKKDTETNPKGQIVQIAAPVLSELVESIGAPGQIESKLKVDISAKVASRIIEMPYKEGDHVTKGDLSANPPVPASVLVRLDAKDLESQLRSAQAGRDAQAAQIEVEKARIESQKDNLRAMDASVKQVQQDYQRQKQLLETRDISQSTFDQYQCKLDEMTAQHESAKHSLTAAELNLVVMEHNLAAADAHIEQAREALEYTTIRSPIDGIITRINAEVGELVMTGTMNNPGTVIMQVADLSRMIIAAEIDEANVGQLKVGQDARIRVQAFWDEEFAGIVDSIALTPNISSSTGTKAFRTEILLKGSDIGRLYLGMTADVTIETRRHSNVLKLPSQAVLGRKTEELPLEIRNSPCVDKAKSVATVVYRFIDNKAVVTPVKIGPSDTTHIVITEGISEGDRVVVGPYKALESISHDQRLRDEKEEKPKKDTKPKDGNSLTGSNS